METVSDAETESEGSLKRYAGRDYWPQRERVPEGKRKQDCERDGCGVAESECGGDDHAQDLAYRTAG